VCGDGARTSDASIEYVIRFGLYLDYAIYVYKTSYTYKQSIYAIDSFCRHSWNTKPMTVTREYNAG